MRKKIPILVLLILLMMAIKSDVIYPKEEPTIKHSIEVSTETTTIETPTTQEITTEQPHEPNPPNLSIPLDPDIQRFIYEQCEYEDDLYILVIAMIEHESEFNADVVSPTNDYGLMQINGCNREYLCDKYGYSIDLLNPYDNTYCGINMIRELIDKYEYKNLALMAYNMGDNGARKAWKNGIYSTNYSMDILDNYEKYLAESEVN